CFRRRHGRKKPKCEALGRTSRRETSLGSSSREAFSDCRVEDIECELDLLLGDRDRRRDAEDTEATTHHARHHAELKAGARDPVSKLRRRRLGGSVLHQVEASQQAAPAHVADACVTLLQSKQPIAQMRAQGARTLCELVADYDLQYLEADGGRQWVGRVCGVE